MSSKTVVKQNAINWFEIPCEDLERATNFYETMLGAKMQRESFGHPKAMAIFDSI